MMRGNRIPGQVWALVALVVIGLLVVLAVVSIGGDQPILFLGTLYTNTLEQDYEGVESVSAALVVHSGDMRVNGGTPGDHLSARISYTYDGDNPTLDYTVEGEQGVLRLTQPPYRDLILLGGHRVNAWDLQFGDVVPLRLAVEIDDGYFELDARQMPLAALDITAESADLDLDLRAAWDHDLPVVIYAGRGDVTLHLPETVGVRVLPDARPAQLNTGHFSWKDDGTLINAAYGSAAVTLTVTITSERGQITLRGE